MGGDLMPIEYRVKAGDCISSISFEHGFFPDTVWNHPANAALKTQRGNPNVLAEGDIVIIPDKREKKEVRVTTAEHRFRKRGVPAKLRIQFRDNDVPRAVEPYQLTIDDQLKLSGSTDASGWLIVSIPPNARSGVLLLGVGKKQRRYRLELGQLDPADEIRGVQGRLINLGFECGPMDGELNDKTRNALRAFQALHNLEPSGELDAATRNKLRDLHDNT